MKCALVDTRLLTDGVFAFRCLFVLECCSARVFIYLYVLADHRVDYIIDQRKSLDLTNETSFNN